MWWTGGKQILRIIVILWMTAVGGILGANLLAMIGSLFFIPENKGVYVQPWAHAGWYAGTALFFCGAVAGRLRFINGAGLGDRFRQVAEECVAGNRDDAERREYEQPGEQTGLLKSVLFGSMVGGFLGLFLGANMLIFWFSLAYSPFAPKEVVSSVKVVMERRPGSVTRRPAMLSSHPVSVSLCLIPATLGSLAGATAAGILTLKYRGRAAETFLPTDQTGTDADADGDKGPH